MFLNATVYALVTSILNYSNMVCVGPPLKGIQKLMFLNVVHEF